MHRLIYSDSTTFSRKQIFNESTASTNDVVSQVFCCLRRLESSFDSLVRFEEVLLKKIKDAELRTTIDSKKLNVRMC